ncbi:cytochrome P450 [Aspergillus saccharolyticus JOP 1030-1]|uniref:Cytochrome P450 monooxygenase n=1 Tax=Aspergillus saccharolyticus JOP 1030-1 TaxID=1450539 RepID=A0A318ZIK1_9EURO|nr:cytochrome P450 monooxygenase [Aspergillus saccharolyticus JOP 1030-1]PYH46164.1 cytochrome P450 monooxygenase [Aspergillus saccharolyticus JOP 1030-1]
MSVPTLLLALLPLLAIYLWQRLRYLRFNQHASWPQLPPSLLWGHMKALNEFVKRGEPRRHIDHVFGEIQQSLGNPPLFLVDLRPVVGVIGIVCNHEVAEQVSRSTKAFPYSMSKSPTMKPLEPLLGPHSVITAEGEQWKALRKRYNPGFAPQHLLTLLPCIIDKARIFIQCLDKYVQTGEEFSLEDRCTSLTLDIIGAVTMDTDLNAQLPTNQQSQLAHRYRQLLASYGRDGKASSFHPTGLLKPFILLRRKILVHQIDLLLKTHIETKFAELQTTTNKSFSRSILGLSLQDIDYLTPRIIHETADQLKSFLFAGHDTTSILLQWTFYELSRTPRVLDAVRRELDAIFGKETSSSPAAVAEILLAGGDEYLSQMTYIAAVIKEVLRLHPPSGTARYMPPGTGFTVTLPDGQTMCLDGVVIYGCATLVQRDEAVFGPTKDEFWPERWLEGTIAGGGAAVKGSSRASSDDSWENVGGAGTEQIPVSAWRPFERGPRNCIGQGLVNLEVRVILACTVRRFDFGKVGLGAVARDAQGVPLLGPKGQLEVVEELFNTMQVTAKPVDGTKIKVRYASWG